MTVPGISHFLWYRNRYYKNMVPGKVSDLVPSRPSSHDILWFLLILSLVLDEESVDLKVLYNLIAVKRDNIQYDVNSS